MHIKHRGFSLVELMIAMTIGLMISAALIQIFMGSKKTYKTIEASEVVQGNTRISLEMMSESIGLAGYISNPEQQLVFPDLNIYPANGVFAKNAIISGQNNTSETGKLADSDYFTVRYYGHADNLNIDCLGRPIAANNIAQITYYVSARDAKGVAELRCSVTLVDVNNTVVSGPDEDVVISNVDDMQIRYKQSSAEDYIDSPTIWTEVNAVRIGILVASNSEGAREKSEKTYELLEAGHVVKFNDTKIRQTMEKTIAIPNML